MQTEPEYILGTDTDEIARLRFQHRAWAREAYALFDLAGMRGGQSWIDLGCGPGFTSFELAEVVGRHGRVVARDESARFLAYLRAEAERRGLPQIETSLGPVEQLDLPAGSLDGAYARWLFCWLPDPGAALERVARGLRPGGQVVLQEYLDWAAMKLMPRSEVFDAAVAACMRSWKDGGGHIDVSERLPALAAECGLELVHFRPIARVGRVASLEWRWLGEFFHAYLPKLVGRGLLSAPQLQAFHAEWRARSAEGSSWCATPVMADVILLKR